MAAAFDNRLVVQMAVGPQPLDVPAVLGKNTMPWLSAFEPLGRLGCGASMGNSLGGHVLPLWRSDRQVESRGKNTRRQASDVGVGLIWAR